MDIETSKVDIETRLAEKTLNFSTKQLCISVYYMKNSEIVSFWQRRGYGIAWAEKFRRF